MSSSKRDAGFTALTRRYVVATLKARVAEVEAELAQAEERSRGHRRTPGASAQTVRRPGGLNFFRSIVTFPRGWRPEFALRRPLEFPTGSFGGGFHVGRELLLLALLREVRRGQRRRPRYC